MARIELENVWKRFGHVEAVVDLTLDIPDGSFIALLGPSGCGKTTTMNMLSGLLQPTSGEIRFNGKVVNDLDSGKRNVGFVFQNYAIFTHMSAFDNIAFGLRVRKQPADQIKGEVERVAKLLDISHLLDRRAADLSVNDMQKVAIGRSMITNPGIFLLDEPFSNLDVDLRERLSVEVRAILKEAGTTAILVTHDQNEAFAIADQVGIMNGGTIEQWDSAYDIYHRPRTRFVADFIGRGVFVRGVAEEGGRLVTELGDLVGDLPPDVAAGDAVDVLLRPDDIVHDDASPWRATVASKAFRGAEFLYTLALASGTRVLAVVPSHHDHAIGEGIGIRAEIDHVVAFRATEDEA